jgi:periplasmic protein TonB
MFKVLTGEKKRRAISPATITASIAAHLLLLGGLVYASTGDKGPIEVVGAEYELPELPIEPKEPAPPPEQPTVPQPAPDQPATEPVPGEVLQIEEVTEVPTKIEEELPGVRPVDPTVYERDGRLGTYIGPPKAEPTGPVGPPTPPAPGPDMVLDESMVEERPVLDRNGLGRTLERSYPAVLRDARVSGRVLVELIVDENGRPVPGSARVVEASHPAFGEATLRAVERFRFRPAKVAGTPVPVRVTIPIQWTTN